MSKVLKEFKSLMIRERQGHTNYGKFIRLEIARFRCEALDLVRFLL